MNKFRDQFKDWKIIENLSNEDLFNLNSVRIINLKEFLNEHRIPLWNFGKRDEILKIKYTPCNLKTFELLWELGIPMTREWKKKNVLFLGTKIVSIDPEDDDGAICYPKIHSTTSYNNTVSTIGIHFDISGYHWMQNGTTPYYVAVY